MEWGALIGSFLSWSMGQVDDDHRRLVLAVSEKLIWNGGS